jgi:hypothetical protein
MHDIAYDLTASECPGCKKAVLVPADEETPHCYFCGRRVEKGDPARYANINATMQRIAGLIRESKVFDHHNTNTAWARLSFEELGKFVVDALTINEASIRYGYYGKPHEFDERLLARAAAFLDAMQKAFEAARKEVDAARSASPGRLS